MTIFRLARYAESANLAAVTTSSAIVRAVAPVTSPVCVAFVTLAVLAAISVLIELANLSVQYKNKGVIGFDLAGSEENFPAKKHKEAFYLILNNNINTTIHAGEAFGPKSIHQAIHICGAHRIGHGTRV